MAVMSLDHVEKIDGKKGKQKWKMDGHSGAVSTASAAIERVDGNTGSTTKTVIQEDGHTVTTHIDAGPDKKNEGRWACQVRNDFIDTIFSRLPCALAVLPCLEVPSEKPGKRCLLPAMCDNACWRGAHSAVTRFEWRLLQNRHASFRTWPRRAWCVVRAAARAPGMPPSSAGSSPRVVAPTSTTLEAARPRIASAPSSSALLPCRSPSFRRAGPAEVAIEAGVRGRRATDGPDSTRRTTL